MVVSQIIGGLGNQMFQYAAARALALKHGVSLSLDIAGFSKYPLHQGFELKRVFECTADLASEKDLKLILSWQRLHLFQRILMRQNFAAFRCKGFVVEPHFHYWGGINGIGPQSYLAGYWQSEKYFSDFSDQIRHDFTFREPMNKLNADVAAQISSVNAVSLHVRRGDYVSNYNALKTHGLCSLDYYRSAITYISNRISLPHFFVFSDDIPWVQENLKIDSPCVYISHNQGVESYNDMRLMSLCQHHIIANSSFSWWGAWLNRNEEKIVVAPKVWFANSRNEVSDLLPQAWVKI